MVLGSSLSPLKAQYTDLIDFTGTSGSYYGLGPLGSLTLSADTLYGLTFDGGQDGGGNIFSVQTNGTNYNDLVDFNGSFGPYFGLYPSGSLTLSGDTLYGLTREGGIGIGSIFSVQTNGTNFIDLVHFTGTSGSFIGYLPYGSLTLSGDTLYGMSSEGGINGDGNIFSVQTNGTNFHNLINFTGTSGTYIGEGPIGDLTLSGDTLYGMTGFGGINGDGNIFSVQTNGTNYIDLIDFSGTSGASIGYEPNGSLILSGDTLYGMTSEGGVNGYGNIFSVQTNGTNFKDLVDFTGTSGSYIGNNPWGSLTLSGETLYGMTFEGGVNGDGNIFSVQTDGTNFIDLVDFTGTSGTYIGDEPEGDLTLSGNTLFGMTYEGGVHGNGNVFSFKDTAVTTSVNALSAVSGQLKVYPNPNNGMFTISLSHPELVSGTQTIEIYNELGEKVLTSTLPSPNGGGVSSACEINISSQPNGVYFYRVVAENGELIGEGKVVVER